MKKCMYLLLGVVLFPTFISGANRLKLLVGDDGSMGHYSREEFQEMFKEELAEMSREAKKVLLKDTK